MCFWQKLLEGMKKLGNTRSKADPCIYYIWTNAGLVVWTSLIDNNLVMRPEKDMKKEKKVHGNF